MRSIWYIFITLALLSISCAKELAPPGGPEDKTPPMMIDTYPNSGEFGVSVDARIEVDFSERIERRTVTDAIFISPPLENEPRISVKGSKLFIDPDGPLDSVRTYVVTLGARIADIHGNSLPNSVSFAFSTGWTIDSSSIQGMIYDNFAPVRNFPVFAYELAVNLEDSLFSTYPSYITLTGDKGEFKFNFMRQGTYLIMGVADKDKDHLINRAEEKIALPPGMVVSSPPTDATPGFYTLHVTEYDSSAIQIVTCRGGQGQIELTFSGPEVDSTSLRADSITIMRRDSTTFHPDAVAMFSHEPKRFHIWSEKLVTDSTYTVTVAGLRAFNGRGLSESASSCQARLRGEDETPPQVYRMGVRRNLEMIHPGDSLKIYYTEPVTVEPTAATIAIDSITTDILESCTLGPLGVGFMLDSTLQPAIVYTLELDNKLVSDRYGNHPADSLYRITFEIADPESLGVWSGRIVTKDSNLVINLSGLSTNLEYQFTDVDSGAYKWTVYPDKYLVRAFADMNGNRRWDLGHLNPLEYAEPGWALPDTVRIRARFEHTDIELRFE